MKTTDSKEVIYEFGPFTLDPRERVLAAHGDPIHLQAKEFDTLLFLVENNGRAISKEEMMGVLWNDAYVEESNLAKKISRLRKILNGEGEQLIETIPKHGYRFKADIRRSVSADAQEIELEKRTVRRVTFAVDEDQPTGQLALKTPSTRRPTLPLVVSIGLIAVFAISSIWYGARNESKPLAKANTVAVLPFRTLTEQEDDKILAAGLTDALITKLGGIRPLVVRPARAVAQFADLGDPVEIGRGLNVQRVLDGTLLRFDSKIRVNMRLIDVESGQQIWSEKFDSEFTDVFDLEDRISENAARTFLVNLEADSQGRATKRYTDSPVAYKAYVKGRYFWNKRTTEGFRQAIAYFNEAVSVDPSYALAYSGLADCYILLGVWGTVPPKEAFPNARRAVDNALNTDPELTEAIVSLAFVEWVYEWDFARADDNFRRAIELNPNYSTAHHWYSYFLSSMGRHDEAISSINRAQELEGPLTLSINTDIGEIFSWAGRYDEADVYLREVLKIEPNYAVAHHVLAINLLKQDRVNEAITAEETAQRLDSEPRVLAVLAYAHAVNGDFERAREIADELVSLSTQRYVSPFSFAIIHLGLGDKEKALSYMESAFEDRSDTMAILKAYPLLDRLRAEKRFVDLQRRVGYDVR
jgi:DNA-binding winged helix-turn-helix (wHTH) protein/TolB-like protein/Flp pilus assembly protein TadD